MPQNDDVDGPTEVAINNGATPIQLVEIIIEVPKKSPSLRFALMGCEEGMLQQSINRIIGKQLHKHFQ